MLPSEYQALALRTLSGESAKQPILTCALGLAGETGEIVELVKKHLFHGHELPEHKLKDELGDILWYVAVGAHGLKTDLDYLMHYNIQKLKARYPEGFDSNRSINRE